MGTVSVTYRAPTGDDRVIETRGLTFFDGQSLSLDEDEHAAFIAKAVGNPLFEVDGAAPKVDAPRRGRAPKVDAPE